MKEQRLCNWLHSLNYKNGGERRMKVKCLLVMPGKEVQQAKIPANIKFIKALLGKELQMIKINESTTIYLSKNVDYTEQNRIFSGYILIGTFLVVSVKNNKIVSMKKKDIRKYTNMFKLSKHQKKIKYFREEFLEEYYFNQRKMREKCEKHNKEYIFKDAA